MSYCTGPQLAEYLGLTSDTDSALLGDLIARAQAAIDTHCGRTFEAVADSARTFDAVRDVQGRVLYLDRDLCSIQTVTNGDGVVVAANEYVTEPRNEGPFFAIRLLGSAGRAWAYTDDPEGAISVAGKWAYSATAPADIEQACVRLAAWYYRQRDNAGEADRAIVAGNATILPSRIPADVADMLKPYRRH